MQVGGRPKNTNFVGGQGPDELASLAEVLAGPLTAAQVASAAFERLLPAIGASGGALVLPAEQGRMLELCAAVGLGESAMDAFRHIPLDAATPTAEAVRTRRPVWIPSLATTAATYPQLAERLVPLEALATLPLVLEKQTAGALVLGFGEERPFEPDERLFLTAAAAQCATALQRAAASSREREGRDRLELALQAASMGSWDWDLARNQVAWSPQLEAIHGLPPGGFGTTLDAYLAHLHPDDSARVRQAIQASIEVGELHLEYRGLLPSGQIRWFEANGKLTRDAVGEPIAMRGVCMDITARKQAEVGLRESEEQFRTLADHIAQLAWMADAQGWIYWYNQRWHEYTGASLAQMQGWGWTTILHPDHLDRVLSRIKGCYATGEAWEDTLPLRGRDNHYRWFLARALPIRDEAGRIVRWLGTQTDITEQRWSEALLAGERNALELIARGAPTNIVLGELCHTVEQLADDGLIASILLVEGTRLRHGAAPSLPVAYNRAIDGLELGPNVGSCGTAAYRGEQVVVSDIATHPLWADFRDLALGHGLRACWSTPIRSIDDQILGTFALYYREPRVPTAEHLRLAELVGRTAATILERKRADDTRARLVAIVDSSADEITGMTLGGIVTSWNTAASRLYGYTASEMLGRSITSIIPPDQLEDHEAILQRVVRGERVPPTDTARLHKDGFRVDVSLSLSPIRDESGAVIGVSAIGRDVRERRRLEAEHDRLLKAEHAARKLAESSGRRLGLQYRVAELLAAAAPDSMPPVLPTICEVLDWDWGALWSGTGDDGGMLCAEVCQAKPGQLDEFEQASRNLRLARGEGLIGRVWQSGEPAWLDDLQNEPGFARADSARRVGLRSGVVLPLHVGREVVGVMSLMSKQVRTRDADMLATLVGIGDQLGQFLERRQAEDRLRRQSALLELAPVAVMVRDAQRRIVYWNPSAERLYGWTANEARGQVSHELLRTRFPLPLAAHEAILARDGAWEGEVVRVDRDGREVTVSSRWLVVRNPLGDVQTLEISMDVTERKKANEELARLFASETQARAAAEAAINARDEFLAVVSHDLRNPLAAVRGNVQLVRRRLLRGEVPTSEQLLERLESIQLGVTTLSRLVDELHDASLLQAGHQLDLRLQPTDLVAVARDYVRSLQNTSDAHRLHFDCSIAELTGTWDAPRLERVLSNLVSNAVKYSPSGGEVSIRVTQEGDQAVLSVADQGLGIPAGDLPHVFERFRRASNVADRIAGSGLGLAGSRDIVQQHGGAITVESEEGKGSTFTVRLPLRKELTNAP